MPTDPREYIWRGLEHSQSAPRSGQVKAFASRRYDLISLALRCQPVRSGRLAALRFFGASTTKASAAEAPPEPETEGGRRVWMRCATAEFWRLGLRSFRRALGTPAQELMQGKGNFVGVRCAPGHDALELDGILSDSADFHQLGFDDLRVSHRTSSMAHGGHHWHIGWLVIYHI